MQQTPVEPVVAWLDRQATESVWVTSVTVFEARYGIGLLPRRRRLPHWWPRGVALPVERWTCATR